MTKKLYGLDVISETRVVRQKPDVSCNTPVRSNRGNVKQMVDGESFDSKAEVTVWTTLKLRANAGEISDVKRHPRYVLQDGYNSLVGWGGGLVTRGARAITYRPDFTYVENGVVHAVEVKATGQETEAYSMRAKLFQKKYPEVIFEVVKV